MAIVSQKDLNELRALEHELADIRDNKLAMHIESALLQKEDEGLTELLENEMRRNVQLKQRVQEMSRLADAEKQKSDTLLRIWSNFNRGTMGRMTGFAQRQLTEMKDAKTVKKANFEKKLQDEVYAYVKARPTIENFYRNETAQMNDERLLAKNKAELNALRANEATAREMSDEIFQLTVVDIANNVLRYHTLMAQKTNPKADKIKRAKPMRMRMPMRTYRLPPPVVSKAGAKESSGPMMSAIASSSECQEKLDTNEDPAPMSGKSGVQDPPATQSNDKTFHRGSSSRAPIRIQEKSAANTVQRDATEKTLKAPSVPSIAAQTARVENKGSEAVASGQSERTIQSKRTLAKSGSLKVAADKSESSQKPKKNLTFVDFKTTGSDFAAKYSKDEGVTSSNFFVSTDDISNEFVPNNEDSPAFDDDEISPHNNGGQMSADYPEMPGQDDNLESQNDFDEISNWPSLDLDPNGMGARASSPASAAFEEAFKETDSAEENNFENNSKNTADNDDFQFDLGDAEMDFDALFK